VGVAEFRVRASSPLAGVRLGDLHLRVRYGVTVVGQWVAGTFASAVGSETSIEAGAILVVVGAHANLTKVERLAIPVRRRGPIVVAGYGLVGRRLVELLNEAGETTTVIDRQPIPGVDIVGNVLEHATLERARVCWASAVVVTLNNDSEGIFATAVVRDHAPEVPLIVCAERTANIPRLYQAGADFTLSLGQIAGRTLGCYLRGEQAVAIESRFKFIRVAAGKLAGGHPSDDQVRQRTGAVVVAVERGPAVIVDFDERFSVRADDSLLVCGTSQELAGFVREFRTSLAHNQRG
jgi:Trk K+ transport system NAD-binding subunit